MRIIDNILKKNNNNVGILYIIRIIGVSNNISQYCIHILLCYINIFFFLNNTKNQL